MSNEPIALGGDQPIALGAPSSIALGPPSTNDSSNQDKKNGESDSKMQEEKPQSSYRFADEVRIGDETIFTIPVEHIFYDEEAAKPKRKSRWGEKERGLKKKVHQDVVFNPYQALTGGSHLLPITDGSDPTKVILTTGMIEEDKSKDNQENKRGTKWGPDWEKSFQPPVYNNIPKGLSIDDVEYLMRLHRLDEITRNLNIGELEINDPDIRSPSPDPVYDKNGVRVNTRVIRAKEKLQREKNDLIEECMRLRKTFVPPADYKPPKKNKKIFLPEADGPDNQYIGLVLGPKGVTQKALEGKTGCKISVRGKGSSKQKRMEYDSDEKLHVLIQADTDEALESGAKEVEKILRGDVEETTEAQKNRQLQVAAIGSALGDEFCNNCGEPGHKSWNCPNKASFQRATIKCMICGDRSHPTSDCPQKKVQGTGLGMHHEFSSFMASVNNKQPTPQNSFEHTSFLTNTPKPVLALTFGGGTATSYPNPTFPTFGGGATPTVPIINPYATQPPAPQPTRTQPQASGAIYSAPADSSTITRPPAYSMAATSATPYFINPMMMSYIPATMQGSNQQSNITIMPVNPNAPMGITSMGMPPLPMQPGAQGYMPGTANPAMPNMSNTGNFQYSTNLQSNIPPYTKK